MRLNTAHLEVIVAVVVGFPEDRMMDKITGRICTAKHDKRILKPINS